MSTQHTSDVLIIGSGAAGLGLALRLAEQCTVTILAKSDLSESNTYYAQGGISAVLDDEDSLASHIEDTMIAGAGLCDKKTVEFTVEHGAEVISWLVEKGVSFSRERSEDGHMDYHLTREGGHSHRRVVHAADTTGIALSRSLSQRARNHPNISIYERHLALDLITKNKTGKQCQGAYVYDRDNQKVHVFKAPFVVLATGGAGKVYLYTSNPDVATGDGIAMAWRAGCRVANMEFIQFHPTCLFHPDAKSFLISEAVRGEGGRLLLPDGTRFMLDFDERGELAPRDIVARAIDHEMKRLGLESVYLDISHLPEDKIKSHFPNIYERCKEFGYDMTRQPIPVVPAAHYTCGGVCTDLNGRTDLGGLYAIGEVAHTGLHGANRMASNSLLECLVFAESAALDIEKKLGLTVDCEDLPEWDESRVTDSDEEVVVAHNWDELRRFMWDYVGIVRSTKRLERARRRVELLQREIAEYYGNFRVTNDLIELRNLVQVAELIINSALAREESRGLHYTLDYPETNEESTENTILIPDPD